MNLKEESISKRKYNLDNWDVSSFPSFRTVDYYDPYLNSNSLSLKKLEFGDISFNLNNYSREDRPTYMTVIKSINVNLQAISIESYTEYNLEEGELYHTTRRSDLFPVIYNRMYVAHGFDIKLFWKLSFSEFKINELYSTR